MQLARLDGVDPLHGERLVVVRPVAVDERVKPRGARYGALHCAEKRQ
jgi:hypothetical protein